jgi:hypothetical protein
VNFTKFTFGSSTTLQAHLFVQSIVATNPSMPYEVATFDYVPVASTSTVNVTLSTDRNTYLKEFKIFILAFDPKISQPNIIANYSSAKIGDI